MSDSEKLTKIEEYISINTVYYKNLLSDPDITGLQKNYLEGKISALRNIEKEFFNGQARIDF